MPEETQAGLLSPAQLKTTVATAIGNGGIADSILKSFNTLATQGQLVFPKGYNVGNQLKLMYTSLSQNGNLTKATPVSIGEALTEAVIQGLEIDKKQVYFIVYGNKLQMFRSYYGDVAVSYRTGLVKYINARVIYEDDTYELDVDDYGNDIVVNHKTALINRDKNIVGAYAWADYYDGSHRTVLMTWKEIQTNWSKSKSGGAVQKEFPQEMAKRTVIRRLVKMIFNTFPTADFNPETSAIIRSYNKTTEDEYEDTPKSSPTPSKPNVVSNIIADEETGEIIAEVEQDETEVVK